MYDSVAAGVFEGMGEMSWGYSIVPHLDGTLITQRPREEAPSGPGWCTDEGTDHRPLKSVIPHKVQNQPLGLR